MKRSKTLKSLLDKVPGKKTFGIYRFMPIFFLMGAALEFSMINWRVNSTHDGEINFYNTFKKRRAEDIAKFIVEARIIASLSQAKSPTSQSSSSTTSS